MKSLPEVDATLGDFGGSAAVAEMLGLNQRSVENWRWRGIPGWAREKLDKRSRPHDAELDPVACRWLCGGGKPRLSTAIVLD